MSWQTINADSLKEKLTGPEVSALQTAALSAGQDNPIPNIITRVVDEVRGNIAAGGFSLETGTTVPSKLVDAALTMIAWRSALRLNVKLILSSDRSDEYKNALKLLERVADGRFAIEEPVTASTEVLGSPSPSFADKDRNYTRTSEDGI